MIRNEDHGERFRREVVVQVGAELDEHPGIAHAGQPVRGSEARQNQALHRQQDQKQETGGREQRPRVPLPSQPGHPPAHADQGDGQRECPGR